MMLTLVSAGVVFLMTIGGNRIACSAIPLMEPVDTESSIEDNSLERSSGLNFVEERREWVTISKPPPSAVHRIAGALTELECEASGSPAPSVQWLRDNVPISESEEFENNELLEPGNDMAKVRSRLIISNFVTKEKTSYTCLAQSGVKTAFHTTTVFTNGKPHNITEFIMMNKGLMNVPHKPRVVLYYSVVLQNIGSTLIIPCRAVGSPRPEVYWVDNEDEIVAKQDSRRKILRTGELIIQGLRWSDMGGYTCVARNAHGKDTTSTFVYPMMPEN